MSTPLTDKAAFRLVWRDGAYYVSKPGIESVDVVPALLARELENANAELLRENVRMESDAYRGDDDEKRHLRAQIAVLREKLEYIRGLGEVYSYPNDWNCMKEGGHPPIDAYQRIDLAEVASTNEEA